METTAFVKKVFWALCCPMALTAVNAQQSTQQLWVNVGFYSRHFDQDKGLRDANPGLGFEYRFHPNWSATAGRFINSNNRDSHYIGAYFQPWRAGSWRFGVVGGAFNGYPNANNGGWFPAVLPVATWESDQVGMNVIFVPPMKDRLYGAITWQLKFKIKD